MPRCTENDQRYALERRRYEIACRLVALGYDVSEIAARRTAPGLVTLRRWLSEDADFRSRYENARDARMERLADSIVALADDKTSSPRDRRLGIDARKWRIAHMEKKAAAKDRGERGDAGADELVQRLREAHERIAREASERASDDVDVQRGNGDQADPKPGRQRPVIEEPKAIVPAAKPEPAPEPTDDKAAAPGDGSWSIRFFPPSEGVADVVAGNHPADD